MQITLFGVLWCFLIFWAFFQSNIKKILFVTFLSMIFQCNNIIVIDGTGIGAQVFTVAIACIRLLLEAPERAASRKPKYITFFLVFLLVIILLSMIINNGFTAKQIIPFMVLIVYTLFFILLMTKRLSVDDKWLEKTEDFIVAVVLIVGFLQVLTKAVGLPLNSILRVFIYNDVNNSDVVFNYKTTSRFYSTFMEPSYCGAFLVGLFALIALRKEATLKNIILSGLIVIAIVLTESSTAYGGFVIISVILIFVRAKKKVYKILLPILIICMLGLIMFNMEVLNEVIFNKVDSGSYKVRNNWNKNAIKEFKDKPIFGAGFRSLRASSLWYSILGETGILGAFAYCLILLYYAMYAFKDGRYQRIVGRSVLIIGIIISQFIACPDLTLSPFWLAQYWFVLAYKTEKPQILLSNKNRRIYAVYEKEQ